MDIIVHLFYLKNYKI